MVGAGVPGEWEEDEQTGLEVRPGETAKESAAKAAAPFVPSGATRKPDAKGLAAAAAKLSVAAPAFVPKAKAAGGS